MYAAYRTSQAVLVVKNPPVSAGDEKDAGSIPGLGRSPGGGLGNSLQYSCLENHMNRGPWWVTVHRVTKSQRVTASLWPAFFFFFLLYFTLQYCIGFAIH